jgi:DNA-directed RNA polymerase alpha subunit
VDREKLWGLSWWVEWWLGTREDEKAAEVKRLNKEIDELKHELDRAWAIVMEMKSKALTEVPQPATVREIRMVTLGLPRRTVNALQRAGVHTIGDYLLLSEKERWGVRGLGAKSVKLLSDKIEELDKGGTGANVTGIESGR